MPHHVVHLLRDAQPLLVGLPSRLLGTVAGLFGTGTRGRSRLTRTTTPTANGTTTQADAGSTPVQPGAGPRPKKTCANNRTNAPPVASAAGRTGSRTATLYTAIRNVSRIGPYG
ncbi:hypothetical protein AB0B24_05615 [Micromonospora parva]